MKDLKLEDCIKKLDILNKEDSIGMVWQWVKQGNINSV